MTVDEKIDWLIQKEFERNSKPSTASRIWSFATASKKRVFIITLFIGIIIGMAFMLPFVSGEKASPLSFLPNPIRAWFSPSPPSPQQLTPQAIARQAPRDSSKMKILPEAFRKVTEQIGEGSIPDREAAISALSTNVTAVLADPAWSKTIEQINKHVEKVPWESFGGKLTELAEAFENETKNLDTSR